MSTGGPGGNPFEGLPFFGDLAKLFSSSGPVNWELARQTAVWVASEGRAEANVEPLERIAFEELVRVAELHVEQQTGFPVTASGRAVTVAAVTRGEWARRTLAAYQPVLERLSTGLTPEAAAPGADDDPDEAMAAGFLGELTSVLNPVLLGMQCGFMVGHLSQSAFGQYDLPIPRPSSDELLVVPVNVDAFAAAWSLPPDDLRLWLCLSELTHHAVLSRPHVAERILSLLGDYAAAFRRDPAALEDKLGAIDPTDPESFQRVLGDPRELLGAMRTPQQEAVTARLTAVVAALEGYVDHVLDTVGARLIGSYARLTEALRRNRVERGEGERFVEQLLGLELGQDQFDRGSRFVEGVVERAGEDGLARLWRSERELPTPAEIDAPGLWLARIDLPDD